MPINPHPVEQAASFLQTSSASPKETLVIGGKLLWAATVISKDWTPQLLDRARTAYKSLSEHGTMARTVQEMDDKAASQCLKQFTADVTELAAAIVQARSQPPRKS